MNSRPCCCSGRRERSPPSFARATEVSAGLACVGRRGHTGNRLLVVSLSAHDRRTGLCAAVHESEIGTFRTWRDVRLESAFGGKAEVGLWPVRSAFDPEPDLPCPR